MRTETLKIINLISNAPDMNATQMIGTIMFQDTALEDAGFTEFFVALRVCVTYSHPSESHSYLADRKNQRKIIWDARYS